MAAAIIHASPSPTKNKTQPSGSSAHPPSVTSRAVGAWAAPARPGSTPRGGHSPPERCNARGGGRASDQRPRPDPPAHNPGSGTTPAQPHAHPSAAQHRSKPSCKRASAAERSKDSNTARYKPDGRAHPSRSRKGTRRMRAWRQPLIGSSRSLQEVPVGVGKVDGWASTRHPGRVFESSRHGLSSCRPPQRHR